MIIKIDFHPRLAKAGVHQEKGWANSAYGMSKLGLTMYTTLQQQQIDADGSKNILVNCVSTTHDIILIKNAITN